MCIIVAKPAGKALPNEDVLDNCFESNKDGIGFSYSLPGQRPVIDKGYADVKKLLRVMASRGITREHNLVIHFRFATHGVKDQGNCHPFPLSPSFDDMRLLHCSCDCAVSHNGVFSGLPRSEKYSDTQKFIGSILASPEVINNIDSKSVKELIKGYCGYSSKLAFLRPQGLSLVGDFEEDEGVFYSNRQYKRYAYSTHNGQSYCYVHKIWDNCTYCSEHKAFDDCSTRKIEIWKDRFKEDIKSIENKSSCCESNELGFNCDFCQVTDGVKWDNEHQVLLCEDCRVSLTK